MKHETRIRTLETKNKEQEKMLVSKGILLNNNGHNDLDPDEVWDEVSMTNQDIRTTSRYNKHQEFGSESNSKKALCAAHLDTQIFAFRVIFSEPKRYSLFPFVTNYI